MREILKFLELGKLMLYIHIATLAFLNILKERFFKKMRFYGCFRIFYTSLSFFTICIYLIRYIYIYYLSSTYISANHHRNCQLSFFLFLNLTPILFPNC